MYLIRFIQTPSVQPQKSQIIVEKDADVGRKAAHNFNEISWSCFKCEEVKLSILYEQMCEYMLL